ncbi:SDR family oxidoreductase [Rhodococcus olei]|uniref:3-oxoacyl-[acyl-carrier-protein] reductase MabA n=1 Tax=Rhodococcus olei TaxID=2161675 RepID=A0ABP8PTQ7_9NOCA
MVIVGGTSGVGLASARLLARQGVGSLVLVGRDAERGKAAAASVEASGSPARFVAGDAGDGDGCARIVESAAEHLGGIDAMVCSVAQGGSTDVLHRMAVADIVAMLNSVALPPLLLTRAVLPLMREQRSGSIVNIASDAAKTATPGEAVVGAAMAAIVMFSRAVALEAKRYGVRINVLTPSLISGTRVAERIFADEFGSHLFDKVRRKAGLGVPDADDLAELVAFLVGPGAAKITGQAISVNGGVSAA